MGFTEVKNLKEFISTGNFNTDILVLVVKNIHDAFLADQYIHEIVDRCGYEVHYIDSVKEALPSSLDILIDKTSNVYINRVEKFTEDLSDYTKLSNVIVVCQQIDKKVKAKLTNNIVEMPEPQEWTVIEFLKSYCQGLTEDAYKLLYDSAQGSVYKILTELDKIKLFDEADRMSVFFMLKDTPQSDLYKEEPFAFTNAVISNNKAIMHEMLVHRNKCDLDPLYITTILLNNYKDIFITANTNLSFKDSGMKSEAKYNYYKKIYKRSSIAADLIVDRLKVLSSIDSNLKLGKYELSNDYFMDYILCQILC